MEIIKKLTEVFREVFADETVVLSDEMTADDVDAWDSMSYINLILAIEIAFEIEFQQHEIQNFANVGDLKQSIQAKLDQR